MICDMSRLCSQLVTAAPQEAKKKSIIASFMEHSITGSVLVSTVHVPGFKFEHCSGGDTKCFPFQVTPVSGVAYCAADFDWSSRCVVILQQGQP